MRTREATIKDINEIHRIASKVSEFSVSADTVNFWPKKILQNCVKSKSGLLLVAEENGKIIGFIIVNYNPTFSKAIIENIFVSPQYRGKRNS
jgi:ribosomal protein S18 acetylase RimI-like enzyme